MDDKPAEHPILGRLRLGQMAYPMEKHMAAARRNGQADDQVDRTPRVEVWASGGQIMVHPFDGRGAGYEPSAFLDVETGLQAAERAAGIVGGHIVLITPERPSGRFEELSAAFRERERRARDRNSHVKA